MKKKVLVLAALLCSVLSISAADYAYLVFVNTSGTQTNLSVSGLTLTVNGSSLDVTNGNASVSFTLTDLSFMQFSKNGEVSALENVLNADKPVEVYILNGAFVGTFENVVDAASKLEKGAYIFSDGNNAQKMVVQ